MKVERERSEDRHPRRRRRPMPAGTDTSRGLSGCGRANHRRPKARGRSPGPALCRVVPPHPPGHPPPKRPSRGSTTRRGDSPWLPRPGHSSLGSASTCCKPRTRSTSPRTPTLRSLHCCWRWPAACFYSDPHSSDGGHRSASSPSWPSSSSERPRSCWAYRFWPWPYGFCGAPTRFKRRPPPGSGKVGLTEEARPIRHHGRREAGLPGPPRPRPRHPHPRLGRRPQGGRSRTSATHPNALRRQLPNLRGGNGRRPRPRSETDRDRTASD